MTDFDETDSAQAAPSAVPPCPKCGGDMWDNREGKRNPKAPDFKCKDRGCDGVIWPPRTASAGAAPVAAGASTAASSPSTDGAAPSCPICGGPMWDDRTSKRNPKAPDFKCRNKPKVRGGPGCEGVIWPPRDGKPSAFGAQPARPAPGTATARPRPSASSYEAPPPYDGPPPDDDDLLPF